MKRGHIPIRMCCICRTRAPKTALNRHVRSIDGHIMLDGTCTSPGRGLYVCNESRCQEAMTRRSAKKNEGAV